MDLITNNIKNKIYTLRGVQVMLDSDLANFYEIETKVLNQAVKRNLDRFPEDFMFQLNEKDSLRSQFVTSTEHGGRRYFPYVFTEQGIAMLAGILRSKKAIEINVNIMRAFVLMRKILKEKTLIDSRFDKIETKLLEHNNLIGDIFDLLEDNKILEKQEGIYFEGQVFDAYVFVSDLVRKAKNRIILIDNYIDESVLILFSKKRFNIELTIYTKEISETLKFDIVKFNNQYGEISIKKINFIHDRFLIIDSNLYHFGASLKDLGKKLFAFSKLNSLSLDQICEILQE